MANGEIHPCIIISWPLNFRVCLWLKSALNLFPLSQEIFVECVHIVVQFSLCLNFLSLWCILTILCDWSGTRFQPGNNQHTVGLEMYSSYKHLLLLFIRVQEKPLPLAFQLSLTSCIKELSKKLIERMKTRKRLTFQRHRQLKLVTAWTVIKKRGHC